MLGIALESGRSRPGREHDLENPYRDEKVQSASTFLRSAARPPDSSNKQLLVLAAGDGCSGQWKGVCCPPAGLVWSNGVCKAKGPASKVVQL